MDLRIESHISKYPKLAQKVFHLLYAGIYNAAKGDWNKGIVEEDMKWGEPSFKTRHGSPIRMDWKESSPDKVCVYFNCNTKLVHTFRQVFGEELEFEGNRAVVLSLDEPLPMAQLDVCLRVALEYRKRRNLPLLGC